MIVASGGLRRPGGGGGSGGGGGGVLGTGSGIGMVADAEAEGLLSCARGGMGASGRLLEKLGDCCGQLVDTHAYVVLFCCVSIPL